MLCRYLKFLSKKPIAFSTSAILQFDDEFRGMLARGEATYDDQWSLNELQAHHFVSSAVKASNSRPRNRRRPHASHLPTDSLTDIATSGTRIAIAVEGAITFTRVLCATPLSTVLFFIVPNLLLRKNRPPIDHILLPRQRTTHLFQMVFLHRSFSPDPDFQSICSLTRHFDTRCREMASDPGDKDFVLSGIAHGFHLVNDLSSTSSADFTNYLSAETGPRSTLSG